MNANVKNARLIFNEPEMRLDVVSAMWSKKSSIDPQRCGI